MLGSNPLSRDLKIISFSLQLHGKRLVEDTTLELSYGNRYGLLGSNGSGKSTFLTCLAARELPIPDHIDIYHLDEEAEPSDRCAIDAVVDVVRSQVEKLEALAEHICETAGPEADILQDIYDRIDKMDPSTFEARATEILIGLGFSRRQQHISQRLDCVRNEFIKETPLPLPLTGNACPDRHNMLLMVKKPPGLVHLLVAHVPADLPKQICSSPPCP